jgi:chromosome segregation ATPase
VEGDREMSENATCCSCGKSRINPDKHRCIPELKEELNEWQRQVCGQGEVISLLNDKLFAADATIAALKAELAEAKSALHDVCLECKDWEYNYGRLCKSYAKITGELAEYRGRIERAIEWLNENIINYCPECSLEIDIIDWDALEQILQGTDQRIRVK